MSKSVSMRIRLDRKIRVEATLVFETAWRIGSGREGQTMSDLGVVLDPVGQPVLPGSSVKGRLRSTCEGLAHALGMSACMLNSSASRVNCASDINYYTKAREEYLRATKTGLEQRLRWISENTCDVCSLFGSPIQAGRLRVREGALLEWASVVQVRNGVVIDRDSHTSVDRLKYDYEVVPSGSQFRLCFELENPEDQDTALLGAALFEWHGGSSIGGFTSRGLGRFKLEDIKVLDVDLHDIDQRIRFLTASKAEDRFIDRGAWDRFFTEIIQRHLQCTESTEGKGVNGPC